MHTCGWRVVVWCTYDCHVYNMIAHTCHWCACDVLCHTCDWWVCVMMCIYMWCVFCGVYPFMTCVIWHKLTCGCHMCCISCSHRCDMVCAWGWLICLICYTHACDWCVCHMCVLFIVQYLISYHKASVIYFNENLGPGIHVKYFSHIILINLFKGYTMLIDFSY